MSDDHGAVDGDQAVIADAPEPELAGPETGQPPVRTKAPRSPGAISRLYHGGTSFDFIGRKRWWFTISAVIIVAGLVSLGVRGFNLGIDFKGGSSWTVIAPGVTVNQTQTAMTNAGLTQPTVEILGGKTVQVQADLNSLSPHEQQKTSNKVQDALAKLAHKSPKQVSVSTVGPTWGGQVTQQAIEALIIFFVLIALYISIRFEWKMAVAAIIAVLHDVLITAGIYSLAGLQVTPDTVIAVLTILGYSLYDTVVVFDRVRENTKGLGASGRMTYSDMVNLSMNQTLARSINTSLVAILPVFAILVVGAEILGAFTLQDFGLALLVGLISGAYSSIFIASPVLAMLKEREPRYITIRQRLETRGDRLGVLTPAAAAMATTGGGGGASRGARAPAGGPIRPGAGRRGAAASPRRGTGGAPATVAGGGSGSGAATGTSTTGSDKAASAAGSGAARPPAPAASGNGQGAPRRPPPRPRKQSKNRKKRR